MYTHLYMWSSWKLTPDPTIIQLKTSIFETQYMSMVVLMTVAIIGTVISSILFIITVVEEYNVKEFIIVSILMGINVFVLFESFWTVIWFYLEFFAPLDFTSTFIIPYGNKFYAWGIHPYFPTIYWDRSNIWFIALFLVLLSSFNLLVLSEYRDWFAKSSILCLATFVVTTTFFSNLSIDIRYGLVAMVIGVSVILYILMSNLYNSKAIITITLILIICLLLININAVLSKPNLVSAETPMKYGEQYLIGSAEYIPSFTASYTVLFSVYGDGAEHDVILTVSSLTGFPSISVPMTIKFDGTVYSSALVNMFCTLLQGQSVYISLTTDVGDCYVVIMNDIKLQLGPLWFGGYSGELIGVNYV